MERYGRIDIELHSSYGLGGLLRFEIILDTLSVSLVHSVKHYPMHSQFNVDLSLELRDLSR